MITRSTVRGLRVRTACNSYLNKTPSTSDGSISRTESKKSDKLKHLNRKVYILRLFSRKATREKSWTGEVITRGHSSGTRTCCSETRRGRVKTNRIGNAEGWVYRIRNEEGGGFVRIFYRFEFSCCARIFVSLFCPLSSLSLLLEDFVSIFGIFSFV